MLNLRKFQSANAVKRVNSIGAVLELWRGGRGRGCVRVKVNFLGCYLNNTILVPDCGVE